MFSTSSSARVPTSVSRTKSNSPLGYLQVAHSALFPYVSLAVFATSRSDYYNECTVLDQLQEVDKLALESEQRLVQKLRRDQLNAKPEDFNRITKELEDEKIVLTRLVRQVGRIMSKEEADACLIDRYVQ